MVYFILQLEEEINQDFVPKTGLKKLWFIIKH